MFKGVNFKPMAIAGILGLLSCNVLATDETLLGVVNVAKVIAESKHTKAVKQSIEDKYSDRFKALKKRSEEMEAAAIKFAKEQPTMSVDDIQKTQSELETKAKKLMMDKAKYEKEISSEQQMIQAQMISKLKKIVASIATEQHMAMVLPANSVVYALPTSDITAMVADRFEQAD